MTGLVRAGLLAGCVLAAGCRYGQQDAPFWGSHADAGPPRQCSTTAPSCPGGCFPGTGCGPNCECLPTARLVPALRSTNIAVRPDGIRLAAAMRDGNAVGVWALGSGVPNLERSIPAEDPRALAWAPRGNVFYVAERARLSQVTVDRMDTIAVCAEPTSVVVSPSGATAYVGCLEGVVVEVDLASFTVRQRMELRNAFTSNGAPLPSNAGVMTLALTNNGDARDEDETLVIPLFWAEPVQVAHPADADLGGIGVVALLSVTGNLRRVDLLPTPDTGFAGAGAFMNQLSAVTVDRGRAYIAALAASPRGPPGPAVDMQGAPAGSQNVLPMVAVVDVASARETSRININALLQPLAPPRPNGPAPRVAYLSTLSSLAFVEGTGELLVVSVAADAMLSLLLDEQDRVVRVGKTGQPLLELGRPFFPGVMGGGGPVPYGPPPEANQPPPRVLAAATGLAVMPRGRRAFVVGEISQTVRTVDVEPTAFVTPNLPDLGVVDVTNILAGRTVEEVRGKFFFFTSTGRWGNQGMTGCLACHPGGGTLPDGVTWYLSPGPRQTISLESLYGKTADVHSAEKTLDDHRAQTWTANTDELADLEGNTRNVSGGFGALATARPDGTETRMDTSSFSGLNSSSDWQCGNVAHAPDWIDVAAYLRTLRKPAGVVGNVDQVARGRALFETANCAACHGGSKWSSSQIPYAPAVLTGSTFPSDRAHAVPVNLDGGSPFNTAALVIEGDDVPADPAAGVPTPELERLACVLRNVDTYFVDGGQSPLEIRGNMQSNNWAQGRAGFNPPPLTGLRYGAPFLHRGQVATLHDLLKDPAWAVHRTAGNSTFYPSAAEVDDLVAFLESIDDTTPVVPPPAGYNNCPRIF